MKSAGPALNFRFSIRRNSRGANCFAFRGERLWPAVGYLHRIHYLTAFTSREFLKGATQPGAALAGTDELASVKRER